MVEMKELWSAMELHHSGPSSGEESDKSNVRPGNRVAISQIHGLYEGAVIARRAALLQNVPWRIATAMSSL